MWKTEKIRLFFVYNHSVIYTNQDFLQDLRNKSDVDIN